jgi:dTDP-4-dehydrorhamnose 3,5-epimerase-like enzyme
MKERLPIHDLYIRPLEAVQEPGVTRWPTLKESDELLRRFGEAEVIRLEAGRATTYMLRPVADEVWAILEGVVEMHWHDLRPRSPTNGVRHRMTLRQPTLVLAPFGVAFGARALEGAALLARFATHGRDDPESRDDRALEWETSP